ncbi:MAG: hypothetical protein ABIZ70_06540 [Gemmatimonadales bacterium]
MRLIRRISATALVASLALLASCGDTAKTTPTDPTLDLGIRDFTISSNPSWTKEPADPLPVDSRTVLIGGLISAAGYPKFGATQYTGGGNDWLDMSTSPNFSRNPLGWNFTFRLKPSAAALPIGVYVATIPVNVPAATNNPQMLTVTFSNCGNCLFLGSVRTGVIGVGGTTWTPSTTINTSGSYIYQDWRLFLDPGQSAYVQMVGGSYVPCNETGPLGDLSDPHMYVFTAGGASYIGSNDDYCGYSSQVGALTNGTGTRQEYLVRTYQHGSGTTGGLGVGGYNYVGTYTVRVVSVSFGGGGGIREQGSVDKKKIN